MNARAIMQLLPILDTVRLIPGTITRITILLA